jgi:hypothetical protein
MNEKGSVDLIESFPVRPANYKTRVNKIFELLSEDEERIIAAAAKLKALVAEADSLHRA